MKKLLIGLTAALGMSVAGYAGLCAYIADRITRSPRVLPHGRPADAGIPYEAVQFPSAAGGITLRGWLMGAPESRAVIFAHGKGAVRDDRNLLLMPLVKALIKRNIAVLAFDFRNHGESEGERFSVGQWEQGDIAGAVHYLQCRGVRSIGIIGWSMGAGTAVLSAANLPEIGAIVPDSCFANLNDLLRTEIPLNSGLPPLINPGVIAMSKLLFGIDTSKTNPEEALARLGTRPVMLIYGEDDEHISCSHFERLCRAGASNPNFTTWLVPETRHCMTINTHHAEYIERVTGFFDRHLARHKMPASTLSAI